MLSSCEQPCVNPKNETRANKKDDVPLHSEGSILRLKDVPFERS